MAAAKQNKRKSRKYWCDMDESLVKHQSLDLKKKVQFIIIMIQQLALVAAECIKNDCGFSS